MKKKIISTLLCTAMLATMVAGCGVEKSDGGSDTESSASSVAEMKGTGDNEINILIYAQDHEKAVYQKLIDKFTKEHADEISTVNFEVTTQDEYATKMTAAMTAGELPDNIINNENSLVILKYQQGPISMLPQWHSSDIQILLSHTRWKYKRLLLLY